MPDPLDDLLIGELTAPVPADVVAFADELALAMPRLPLGVLFYGSVLRTADVGGVLDFYIVTEHERDFSGGFLARTGNLLLPPNVRYAEFQVGGHVLRAKIAVLSRRQFEARTRLGALDTTLWARFCQPVRLVWVRDEGAADAVLALMGRCVVTAACWAVLLWTGGGAKSAGEALEFWRELFARTYASELRVEKKGRGDSLLEGQEARFSALLPLAWTRAGLRFSESGSVLAPQVSGRIRERALRRWGLVQSSGKPRNVMRLLKAAFTFEDGAAYLAWKIERHTGIDLRLSVFEKRHPLLMLPVLVVRFWRKRAASGR